MNKFILYRYLESFNSRSLLLDEDYLNFDIVDPSLFPITNSDNDLNLSKKHYINKFHIYSINKFYIVKRWHTGDSDRGKVND